MIHPVTTATYLFFYFLFILNQQFIIWDIVVDHNNYTTGPSSLVVSITEDLVRALE